MPQQLIGFKVEGLEQVQRKYARFPQTLGKHTRRAFKRSAIRLEAAVKEKYPVGVSGQARAKVAYEVDKTPVPKWAKVGSALKYGRWFAAAIHEFGTKPHWPPKGALAKWAQRKGIAEYLVRRKIAAVGTEGVEMFKQAFERNRKHVQREFNDALKRIVRELGT